ncbi:MAG: MarR family winged helix-turn-helix transcriptional regulator [Acutalibacteraceae bacterium]|nr:MarR family winged helix-turn-helix transcriptional regulator [Acutalibacteraceae bacterium]
MIDRFEKFSIAISEISRYWHKIAGDVMEPYGLKGTHAIYLTTLSHHKEGITSATLCEICGKDKSDVSRLVSIMEKLGFVKKEGSNNYRALLKLTEKGNALAEEIKEKACLAVHKAGEKLSEAQRKSFYSALESITENLRLISNNGL